MEEICGIPPRFFAFIALSFFFGLCGWVATIHMIIQGTKPEINQSLLNELKGISSMFYIAGIGSIIVALQNT